ncbi:MAG: diguanylate cyclase, partial [Polyangiaceae bacterium]
MGRSAGQDRARRVLIVDPDRTMAEANRRLLSASGYDVGISAGVASALATLDEGPVDWLVLGLHKRDVARELLEQAAKRSSGPGYRRAMGVRFHDDRVRPTPELAAVVVKPSPPRAVAAVLSDDAQPPELDIISAASLVEGHALGNLDDALARIASGLVRALGVRAAAVTMDTPRSIAVTPTTDERTADELGARVLAAAQSKAPLVMSALVTAYDDQPYDEAFETIVAATAGGVGHRPRVAIGVVLEGARPRAAILRPLLRGLAERVAEERSVEAVRARLAAEIDAVHEMGGLDTMLGIWNRSTLSRLTEMMEAACRRTGQPISTAILNVSGMTRINETYGHREGDALLRHVAEVAVYVVRGSDIVARYQDDDLALVFPGLTAPDAAHVVERIRRTIASQPVRTDDGQEIVVETTAAVSAVHTEDDDGERALARAFEA